MAGTLCNAAAALKQQGAPEVFAYCTHGVLSGGAVARVAASELSELVVTDSICTGEPDPKGGKIRRLTIAPLLAEAIKRISDEASVSSLFDCGRCATSTCCVKNSHCGPDGCSPTPGSTWISRRRAQFAATDVYVTDRAPSDRPGVWAASNW